MVDIIYSRNSVYQTAYHVVWCPKYRTAVLTGQIAVAGAIKILKGTAARRLFLAHPELKSELWGGSLWSPSYYVGTAGNVCAETIQRYIERTEHIKGRR